MQALSRNWLMRADVKRHFVSYRARCATGFLSHDAGAQWVPRSLARSSSNCRTPVGAPRKAPGPLPEYHWVPGRESWPFLALPP